MQTMYVLCEVGTELLSNTEKNIMLNPLNTELNPISHLLALLGAHRILHISRIRVKRGSRAVHTFIPFTLKFKLIIF